MPSEAEAVHGLSTIFLSDKPLFGDKCHELIDFIGDAPLIAHNATFDFGFLNAELERCGRDPVCLSRMICTLVLARSKHPGAKHSLDALCTRFGVDRSLRVKHGALIDAQLLAQCYVELTGGRQIGLSLTADIAPAAGTDELRIDTRIAIRVRPPRPHFPSMDEMAHHAAFLATIPDPLWARFEAPELTPSPNGA
jgi:DNA polymerase-3 subunit epsilon